MTNEAGLLGAVHPTPSDKAGHVRRVAEAIGEVPGELDALQLESLVGDYFVRSEPAEFTSRDPLDLAALVRTHLQLGARRSVGTDLVSVFTPDRERDGWWARGASLLMIVTDDRSFLVDTVTMEVAKQGWSIRNLHHPQFSVIRDGEGNIQTILPRADRRGLAESWIAVEIYPPLGRAATDLTDELGERVRAGLKDVRLAVDDWTAMRRRLRDCVDMLDENTQPVSPHKVRSVTNLLKWLADDHFAFLGYREYKVDGKKFTPVEGTGLGILRNQPDDERTFHAYLKEKADGIIVITKDSRRSPVHRPAYLDYVGVRVFDAAGQQVGEHRFLGLWASTAYSESVFRIPMLSDRAGQIVAMSGFDADSHGGHMIHEAIAGFPRDEMFQASAETLFPIIDKVASLQERREVRLFLRPGAYGRFLSCLVYLPRDRYNTTTRERIQNTLLSELKGESLEYSTTVSESVLARLYFVVRRPDGLENEPIDVVDIEEKLTAVMRTWEDAFADEAATLPAEKRGIDFDESYKSAFTPRQGLADLRLANELVEPEDMRFAVYAPDDPEDPADLRLKVIGERHMTLNEAMPHLSALGVEIIDERPFPLTVRGRQIMVYDFGMRLPEGRSVAGFTMGDRRRFFEAFEASYTHRAEAGQLNRLVMGAGLTWHQVGWLRMISRYLQQAGTPFSQRYIAGALNTNPLIAAKLVDAFEIKFDPSRDLTDEERAVAFDAAMADLAEALDRVSSLDHDRIVRMFMAVLQAGVRTNAFAADQPALAYKLEPRELDLLPQPRPAHEIFVYSPRVMGVHLRFGAVARGGLRWSDRKEDFRTEVLGLVKAQMVKNTVIVPVGAKGGFVPLRLPNPAIDRQAWLDEGIACYRTFIGALLSVTDNIVDGHVVAPADLIRYDGDDPYLVVAADKGTGSFSDIANAISTERGFWLGDAFASGGSAGYDHKGMSITARGAWESVKRHFYEMGIDCQTTDFTCVGIGDMSGDVFGNGMMLSRHIKLVAAFNHQHIFLDPNPDPQASFEERVRLFHLPRSTWADYNADLISAGGGVYRRSAKSIPVPPEVREALGLPDDVTRMSPAEMISAILTAKVDLLWNGGIGTYVKASTETHAQCGDKANDAVRVNGADLRARCVGEGGNLGFTQRARIEYARNGGRINTDFIDNSAGVDTSDHEVNIKILLSGEVAAGRLGHEERNELLASMTDEVAHLVLAHNIDQNYALANVEWRAGEMAASHEAWMRSLEEAGLLDRDLEALPRSEEMRLRISEGRGLSRPELASLLAWTKIRLETLVLQSRLPDDPYLMDRLVTYFPKPLRERFESAMMSHRLRREIVTTVTVNRFVNSQGISAYHRLASETGADTEAIIRAQLATRAILAVAKTEIALRALPNLDAAIGTQARVELQRMVERGTRWLLNNRKGAIDVVTEVAALQEPVTQVRELMPEVLTSRQRDAWRAMADSLTAGGLDAAMAGSVASSQFAHIAMNVAQVALTVGRPVEEVAAVHFALAEALGIDHVMGKVDELPRRTRWETMARAAIRDDLQALHAVLTRGALASTDDGVDAAEVVSAWWETQPRIGTVALTLRQVCEGDSDLAKMSVALRVLRGVA